MIRFNLQQIIVWPAVIAMLNLSLLSQAQTQKVNTMTDLHYQIHGKGSPLVLIHGGGTDSRVWDSIVKELSQAFKVITYDIRGHGKSPVPTKTTNHATDLGILFESLKIDKASLVGHSLGGQVATDFAILNPDKVDQLILLSPGLSGFQYDQAYQEMAQKMWQAVPDVDAMLQIMLHSPEAYSLREAMKSTQAETIVQIHRDNIIKSLQWKNFEQERPIPNTTERLSELKVPVLFIVGTEDKKDLFKIKKLFEAVHNIQFRTVAGADHAIVMTHHDILLKEIKRFLQ